jgi:hypothetical protein
MQAGVSKHVAAPTSKRARCGSQVMPLGLPARFAKAVQRVVGQVMLGKK